MKRALAWLFCLTSCATNLGTGVLTGGVLGTTTGIAFQSGETTLLASAIGIVAGGVLGYFLDEQDKKIVEKNSPRTVERMEKGDPLTLNDIIQLSQSGIHDEVILRYLEKSGMTYSLTKTQVQRLRQSGVSQRIIEAMTL